MPPQMKEHSRKARERLATSLKVSEKMSARQNPPAEPRDPEQDTKAAETLDPEMVSRAFAQLAEKFAAKPAETQPDDKRPSSDRLNKVMSSFSPNTGQPQPPGPKDNSGQSKDKEIRAAVEQVLREQSNG